MRVTHSKISSEGLIDGTDWDADHVLDGFVADDDARLSDARTPTAHAHDYADPGHTHDTAHDHDGEYAAPHSHPYSADNHTHDTSHTHDLTAYATDADLADHAATPHGGSAGEAFPVGSVFLSVVPTNPSSLLGYGTWQAFGAGRMLMGWNTGDTDEATGGAATHTHAAHSGVLAHSHNVTDPGHAHVEQTNSATTGPNTGWAARDTSTNTASPTGYSTESSTTGLTVNSAGSGTEYTHDSPSHLPPYVIVRAWKRTA